MQHDTKSAGGRFATDSAQPSGVLTVGQPLKRRARDPQGLSFVTIWETRRGAYVKTDYFDVPADGSASGSVMGYRMARELFNYVARETGCKAGAVSVMHSVMARVYEVSESGWQLKGLDRTYDAARSFRRVCENFLGAVAWRLNPEWVDDCIAATEEDERFMAEHSASEKAAFVERMRRAKANKAAKLAAPAAQATQSVQSDRREVAHG